MVAENAIKKFVILILATTTIIGPLLDGHLEVQANNFQLAPDAAESSARHHRRPMAQVLKSPSQLVDCERVVSSEGQIEDTERCFAIIEAALRSSYGLDMIRLLIDNMATSSQQQHRTHINSLAGANGQQQQQKARRDLRSAPQSHRTPPTFVTDSFSLGADSLKGQSGEALSKLLMNGLGGNVGNYDEELSMLNGNDKSLWPGAMSDEIQSRWQPMRGKRF